MHEVTDILLKFTRGMVLSFIPRMPLSGGMKEAGAVFFNGKGKTMIRECVGFEAYEAACEGDPGLLGWSPLIPRSG